MGSAFSATVISVSSGVFTGTLDDGGIIVDNTGAATNAVVSLATYSGPAFAPGQSVAEVIGGFTLTGSPANTLGTFGFVNASVTDADAGNALAGQQVYVLIGNNQGDILASTQIAVYTSGNTFPTQVGGNAAGDAENLRPDAGLVWGAIVTGAGITPPFNAANGQPQIAVSGVNLIPEPSVSLLAGLAGLALLIRRKR